MYVIWGSFVVLILALAPFTVGRAPTGGLAEAMVFLHVCFALRVLQTSRNRYRNVFVGALLARFLFMLWDLYARDIFVFPNSGMDSGMYFRHAVEMSRDISLIFEPSRGGLYTQVLGVVFYLVGPSRMVGQYLNVLLGLSVVSLVFQTLKQLSVRPGVVRVILLLAAFFPNSMVMSAIFLREIFPTCFVAASLYFFVLYFNRNHIRYILLTLMMLGIAVIFHTGVIGLLVGYSFVFLFYRAQTDQYRFTGRTVTAFLIVFSLTSVAVTDYKSVFLRKVEGVEEVDDVYVTANRRLGGSAYLKGMTISSQRDIARYGPIKMIYFLAAPVPWDWRGVSDIFTFFFDSLFYVGTLCYVFVGRRAFGYRKTLCIGLLAAIAGTMFIFGIGVSNAGTALRHRQKLIPVFLVLLAITIEEAWRLKAVTMEEARRLKAITARRKGASLPGGL